MSTNRYVVVGGVLAAHVVLIYAALTAAGLVKPPEPIQAPVLTYVELPAPARPEPPAPKAKPEPPKPKSQPMPKTAPPKLRQPEPVKAPPTENSPVVPPAEPVPAPAPAPVPAPAAAVPAPAPATEVPLTAPVFNAAYLNNPKPSYPRQSQLLREEGTVLVKVRVSEAGLPLSTELVKSSGYSRLDNAALDVVKRWRFKPAMRGKEAVEDVVNVPVRFQLDS
ncbi:energy transducer TonB [Chitinolyticbacter albus]|uniref:energy transducer TonB n=1 Tax=Chitinolyticbacter albus TaxID=2961951 RepID=UPI00254646FA|nr:energy transducer TonB [Chitinolyticbacter albus]